MTNPADLDGDGKVSEHELMIYERRLRAQRRMATAALVAVVGFTGLLMTPLLSVERINALSDLFGLFYISLAGIVGAYMGVSGWMSRK
jgi:hypothetical protein